MGKRGLRLSSAECLAHPTVPGQLWPSPDTQKPTTYNPSGVYLDAGTLTHPAPPVKPKQILT
ncbi:MAG: hypothetical protein ACYTEK_12055, partial [Planctomycetota bacterium]